MEVRGLIADDSPATRRAIRDQLEHLGIQVVAEAENVEQAFNLVRAVRPEIVALDAAMRPAGSMDVLTLLRSIRRENPRTPVLVVGDPATPQVRERFVSEGAVDYIVKPFRQGSFAAAGRELRATFPVLATIAAGRMGFSGRIGFKGWLSRITLRSERRG